MAALLMLPFFVFGNDYVKVSSATEYEYHDHDTYEVWFDTFNKNPAYVIYTLRAEDVIEAEAVNNRKSWSFVKCGSANAGNRNYPKSGFDQGHMCSSASQDWSIESAKNTFRACNICPQTPALNRGIWKSYEDYERRLAKEHMVVTIICGPVYYNDKYAPVYIGKDNIRVPDGFFKMFVYDGKVQMTLLFTQSNEVSGTTLRKIEQLENFEVEVLR